MTCTRRLMGHIGPLKSSLHYHHGPGTERWEPYDEDWTSLSENLERCLSPGPGLPIHAIAARAFVQTDDKPVYRARAGIKRVVTVPVELGLGCCT